MLEESDVLNYNYYFKLNIFGLNDDRLSHYQIIYNGKGRLLSEIIGKNINNEKEILEFEIISIMEKNCYNVKLSKNIFNEISLFFDNSDDDNNVQLFNIDLLIQNESLYPPKIKIKYQKSTYNYYTHFNDLNICKISLLDVDLKNLEIYFSQNVKEIKIKDFNYENYKLLGKKLSLNKEIKNEKRISYLIDDKNLTTNKLLFCLNYFGIKKYILTIHEDIEKESEKIYKTVNKKDLDFLDKEIMEKINLLLSKINDNNCNLNDFKSLLLQKLDKYNFENPYFKETDYFIMLEYFKKYIITIICKSIKDIIERFYLYYKPDQEKIKILKRNIKYILLKYKQFNEYIKYVNGEKSEVENLNINNKSPTQKEKIQILSTILTILLSSPIFEINTKIDFMDIEQNQKSIYYKSNELLNKIIHKLNEESYYIRGFRQTFSRIKRDINKINDYIDTDRKSFIIEMRDLDELKILMKNYLPKTIVRLVNNNSQMNAIYDIYSQNIIINEAIFINRELNNFKNNNNEIYDKLNPIIIGDIDFNNDNNLYLYNLYCFKAFWRIIHESFGHKPVSIINNNKADTPSRFVINGEFHQISDAGNLLEYYVIDTREIFEHLLYKNFDASSLLNEDLYVDVSFSKFWNQFNNIKKSEDNKKIYDENDVYLFVNDILEENKNSSSKGEKYIKPRFLWPIHRKLLSII